jgi:hypothetical protein
VNARKSRLFPRKAPQAEAVQRMRVSQASDHPLPPKPPEMAWRDYLIMLLHIGAEIEHGLMVEYLYAAYSLGGEGLPEKQQKEVRHWRDSLLVIAKEEMGHLLTVQNVLCLLGGPVTFERSDFPWSTPFYPFPFRLEPLSLDSVACYVWAEMPSDLRDARQWKTDPRLLEFVEEDQRKIVDAVFSRVQGQKQLHHVGEIYERIIEIIKDPRLIPDAEFRPETYACQASWDDWGRGYKPAGARPGETQSPAGEPKAKVIVARMATRTEVLAALSEVAGQGEAPHLRSDLVDEPSHFDRFLAIFQGLERTKWKKIVRPVATNPSTLDPSMAGKEFSVIENEHSRHWAALFNIRYRFLLTYLTHTFRIARNADPAEPNTRGAVMHKAFGEMYNIKSIAGILMRLPLGRENSAKRAGPPFEMPYTLELPVEEIDCWRLYQDLLKGSAEICGTLLEEIRAGRGLPEGERYLKTLLDLDRQTGVWIAKVIDGLRAGRRFR